MAFSGDMRRRKQTCDSTVSVNCALPMDLILDILSRLPVKTLFQFKSLCKTWYKIIQSPYFISMHLTKLKLNPNPTLASVLSIDHLIGTDRFSMCLLCRYKPDNLDPNILFRRVPSVVGICDGLVCATFDNSTTIICNPSTRLLRKIFQFRLPKTKLDNVFFGFGFEDNEYKLFRIVYSSLCNEDFVRVEVYSMSTDIWREVKVKTGQMYTRPHARWSYDPIPLAIKNVFYWLPYDDVRCVVSFDTNEYAFSMIYFPMTYKVGSKLVDFGGEVAFATCHDTKCIELWVLNEKERYWRKTFSVENLPSVCRRLRILGCERNGNFLIEYRTPDLERKLVLYNLESHNIMYLPYAVKQFGYVFLYTESLLSV